MNKRQRKKQIKRYHEREAALMKDMARLSGERTKQMRHYLIPHPRRHWFSRAEYHRRRDALTASLEAEKAAHIQQVTAELRAWHEERERRRVLLSE
jgi:hypothetical protein